MTSSASPEVSVSVGLMSFLRLSSDWSQTGVGVGPCTEPELEPEREPIGITTSVRESRPIKDLMINNDHRYLPLFHL